jgi:hypothetical protein
VALQLDANGWTAFPKHPDARDVFVSKAGNDANTGLTEGQAKLTIAAGKALLRPGFGDRIWFRRGDTWTNEMFGGLGVGGVKLRGHSEDFPMVIGAYGDEALPRPVFDTVAGVFITATGADGTGTRSDIAIIDLDGVSRSDEGLYSEPHFVNIVDSTTRLTIEGCRTKWYWHGITITGNTGAHPSVRIRRNVAVESYAIDAGHAQGIYVAGAAGLLIEGNYIDWVGDVPRAGSTGNTQFRHGVYVQDNCTGVVYRDNWASRCSAQGHSVRSSAQIVRNSTFECPIGITAAGFGESVPVIVEENVIIDSRPATYTDAASWAISLSQLSVDGTEARNNVVKGWTQGPTSIRGLQITGCTNVAIHGNRFFDYPEVGDWFGNTAPNPFFNNHVQSKTVSTAWRLVSEASDTLQNQANNKYWRQGGDANWFRRNNTPRTFAQYTAEKSDTTSVVEEVAYTDSGRDYARYWTEVCGGAGAMTGLYSAIRDQRKGAWDRRLETKHINNWIAAGLDIAIGEQLPEEGAPQLDFDMGLGLGL